MDNVLTAGVRSFEKYKWIAGVGQPPSYPIELNAGTKLHYPGYWLFAISFILFVLLIVVLMKLHKSSRRILQQKQEYERMRNDFDRRDNLSRQLFESNLALVLTHTLDGVITSANQAILDIFKLSMSEMVGRSLKDFIHSDYVNFFPYYLEELADKKKSYGLMTIVNSEGTKKVLQFQNTVVLNTQGEFHVISFSQDQTDFFKAQQLASRLQKRLSLIMEHSPDTYSVLSREGTIQYMNRSSVSAASDIIGKNIFDFLDEEHGKRFRAQMQSAFDQSHVVQSIEQFKGKFFLTKLIPLKVKGVITELLTVNTDITKLKTDEIELKKLSRIVEQTTNMVVITDVAGRIEWVNQSFVDITGYSKMESLGKNPGKLLQGPLSDQERVQQMRSHIQSQEPFECKLINYSKYGDEYWVKITAQPIIDDQGRFMGYFSIQHNITQEKKLLKQLQEAKERAEESNRLKTIFLGNLSHEVRTPLQGILGFAEILEGREVTFDKRKEYINIIKRRTIDMQHIIESLLDMASLETGEIKAAPTRLNMREAFENIFRKVRENYDLEGRDIVLEFENSLSVDVMRTIDFQHLNQVIDNLVANAIKFTERGKINITCDEQESAIEINVKDTGIGIPADKIQHIFKPFRQAHEGISRAKGGIGLGLSICIRMVEMWGGTLDVSSEIGVGSIFTLTIPNQDN